MIQTEYLFLAAVSSLLLAIFFGGLGLSFLTNDHKKAESINNKDGISSLILPLFLSNPAIFIITMLTGYFLSMVCFIIAFSSLSQPFLLQNLHISSHTSITLIQFIITFLIIVFTVFTLRLSVFRINPNAAMRFFAVPALFFFLVFFLVSITLLAIVIFISRFILRIKGDIKKDGYFNRFTFPDFHAPLFISDPGNENSDDEEPEMKIFQNALEFSKLKVRDCMVPRNEIVALEVSSKIMELREKFIDSGYSKVLVYKDSIDNIIGYVSSKDLFTNPGSIRSILVTLSIVPESRQINKLLRTLIKERRSIALVVDEYGGTSGIITLEDILEEIFGEIEDEHDTQEFVEREINENEFILSGRLEIDYLNEKYKLNIPETEDYDTLAGYIIFDLEDIPEQNTELRIKDLQMRILKVSQTRIELVHITRILA